MTTEYTDAPRTRVMTPASLNNGVHENHSIGQTMACLLYTSDAADEVLMV